VVVFLVAPVVAQLVANSNNRKKRENFFMMFYFLIVFILCSLRAILFSFFTKHLFAAPFTIRLIRH
jgi:hypothetical protein